jgi:pimeloyl-ACP methyl ester carboxylesterase
VRVLQSALAMQTQERPLGRYQVEAAIAALHDDAASAEETDWPQILAWYDDVVALAEGPVRLDPAAVLGRAVAVGHVLGAAAGLREGDRLREVIGERHRWHAVRGHLHELDGDLPAAATASSAGGRPGSRFLPKQPESSLYRQNGQPTPNCPRVRPRLGLRQTRFAPDTCVRTRPTTTPPRAGSATLRVEDRRRQGRSTRGRSAVSRKRLRPLRGGVGARFRSSPVPPKYDRVVAVLRVPGDELYYEVESDGVAVVLVHGLALDARMWDDQVPALTDVARVVRYDVRGFGRSTRDAHTSYSHADDLWRHPNACGRSCCSTPCSTGCRGIRTLTAAFRRSAKDSAPVVWTRRRRRGFATTSSSPRSARRTVARRLTEMVGDYSGVNWTSADPHAPHPNSIDLLATIAAPTTVVTTELDVPCFHEMSDVLANRIANARKVTVPGVGHMVNMEAPEAVNALLRGVVLGCSLA